jgi:hypothetical protein
MKTMDRRLRRLENRYGPPVETEYSRRLLQRIEAGWRRVAEWRDEPYRPLSPRTDELRCSTLAEGILRGRERARQSAR